MAALGILLAAASSAADDPFASTARAWPRITTPSPSSARMNWSTPTYPSPLFRKPGFSTRKASCAGFTKATPEIPSGFRSSLQSAAMSGNFNPAKPPYRR